MVVDTSVLIAILLLEPEAESFARTDRGSPSAAALSGKPV